MVRRPVALARGGSPLCLGSAELTSGVGEPLRHLLTAQDFGDPAEVQAGVFADISQ